MFWMLHNREFLGQFSFYVKNESKLSAAFTVQWDTTLNTTDVLAILSAVPAFPFQNF